MIASKGSYSTCCGLRVAIYRQDMNQDVKLYISIYYNCRCCSDYGVYDHVFYIPYVR